MLQLQQRGCGRTVWGGCSTVGSWVTFGTAVSPSGTDIRHKSLSGRSSHGEASSWAASWWVLSPCTPRASAPTADGGAQDRSPCLALLPEAPNPRGLPSSRGNLNQHGCLLARHEGSSPCTQMPSFASHLWDRGNPLSQHPTLAGCNSPSSLAKWRGKVQQGVRCCCIFLAEEDALCKGCSLPACTHLLKEQLLAHSG